MLKRIYADNYRCLVNFEWRPAPRQLLVGANGSGKSTLFDLLRVLGGVVGWGDSLVSRQIASLIGPVTRTRWQDVGEQIFEVDIAGNGGLYTLRLVIECGTYRHQSRVVHEEVTFDDAVLFRRTRENLGYIEKTTDRWTKVDYRFPGMTSAIGIGEFREGSPMHWLKQWLASLMVIAPDPRRMSGASREESLRLESDLSNFADWYRNLLLNGDNQDYMADLAEIFDDFDQLRFNPHGPRSRELVASFLQIERNETPLFQKENRLAGRRVDYSLDELSDGQRVLIGLYAVLHFAIKPGATVCIDEPDNFVAIREIMPWLGRVFDRTGDKGDGQVLIASHHPEIINYMGFKEGVVLDRPEGRYARIQPFTDPSQTGLGAAELVARGWER